MEGFCNVPEQSVFLEADRRQSHMSCNQAFLIECRPDLSFILADSGVVVLFTAEAFTDEMGPNEAWLQPWARRRFTLHRSTTPDPSRHIPTHRFSDNS